MRLCTYCEEQNHSNHEYQQSQTSYEASHSSMLPQGLSDNITADWAEIYPDLLSFRRVGRLWKNITCREAKSFLS